MKAFVFIISAYLILLSCIPCGDKVECAKPNNIAEAAHHTDDHEHTTEACSPFCYCACCISSTVVQQFHAQIKTPVAEQPAQNLPYVVPFLSYDYNAIWQPPKIA